MTYMSWEPRYRLQTVPPGKMDAFVATFINGRRAALQPITEYDQALATASAFHARTRSQVKVLPLTAEEGRGMGLTVPADQPQPVTPADMALIQETVLRVAYESSDEDARRDALDLLIEMGVLKS